LVIWSDYEDDYLPLILLLNFLRFLQHQRQILISLFLIQLHSKMMMMVVVVMIIMMMG